MYFKSNSSISSKLCDFLDTCHNPVIPGLKSNLLLYFLPTCSAMYSSIGLGPTILASPFKTLKIIRWRDVLTDTKNIFNQFIETAESMNLQIVNDLYKVLQTPTQAIQSPNNKSITHSHKLHSLYQPRPITSRSTHFISKYFIALNFIECIQLQV